MINPVIDRYWVVVPAAGAGRRMGAQIPKQYLPFAGMTVIERTLQQLLGYEPISRVYVVVSREDGWWPETRYAQDPRVVRVEGGRERCHSVLNALQELAAEAEESDWVLVHDAARPCLHRQDLDRLLKALSGHPVGGLLGVPVRDTMKRSQVDNLVLETVSREKLWHAYTPQMFRFGLLKSALADALSKGQEVTDDASAMELAGHAPLLVEGRDDNLKITRPSDLTLAEFYLRQQGLE